MRKYSVSNSNTTKVNTTPRKRGRPRKSVSILWDGATELANLQQKVGGILFVF